MIDLMNLERYSENPADYPLSLKKGDCYKRSFQVELARKLNANADRIEFLMLDIVTTPDRKMIEYKDIMHWKSRATYLRNIGQAKAAKALEKAEALKEAKEADEDEDFMAGYKDFLATEFE